MLKTGCFYGIIYMKWEYFMGESKTLILIDGHALAFREYYALERTGMKTSTGTPTWAVYGFFKAIFDLLKNTQAIKEQSYDHNAFDGQVHTTIF